MPSFLKLFCGCSKKNLSEARDYQKPALSEAELAAKQQALLRVLEDLAALPPSPGRRSN